MSARRTPLHAPSYALAQPAPTVYEHRVTVGGTAAHYLGWVLVISGSGG